MPAGLRIELLGGFRVSAGARAVDEAAWRLRRSRSLIKLLALAPDHSLHREQVIEALWPGRGAAATANGLRQAVFVARRALESCGVDGAQALTGQHEVLVLHDAWVDVEAFESAAGRAALDLYAGELLPEDRFEPWTQARREALRERHLALLLELAEREEDPAAAVAALQQALADEPLHERAHRELMRLYALTGRRQRALAQYHLLRESLRREFEDEPDAATRRVYQDILTRRLEAPSADDAPPAARRPAAPRPTGNVPLQLTSFIGRERELDEVGGLLTRTRLLTLTGPGGCGKTRLALEAAARSRDFADGVWLVELAALDDAELAAHAAAGALGVERSSAPPETALAARIGGRRLLLILDTCEHLIGGCARLAERLLTACPRLVVLATSREPLHLGGEVAWRVPSLAPAEAAQLFAERAADAASPFALTDAVDEICRRLDGIPLAIELAAARTGVLTPAQIAERLRDSLAVLGLTRQQTLAATIDWSHDLLEPPERVLLRRLAVFAGGCTLDAVEAVCDGSLDVLARLVDKSLVIVEEDDGRARYRLLDTVRHYARDRLLEAGESAVLEARHRAYFLALAETADARLEPERDNLRAALAGGVSGEPALAVRLADALWRFWHDRGERVEAARWLEAAVRAAPEPTLPRARALLGLAVLRLRLGPLDRAQDAAEESLAVCRAIDDPLAAGEALLVLAGVHWVLCSRLDVERCCAQAERLGAARIAAAVHHTLGVVAGSLHEHVAARERLDAALALLRELPADGPPVLLPLALAFYHEDPGDGRPPRLIFEETWVPARRVPAAHAVAYGLADRGLVARSAGDIEAARADLEESAAIFRRLGDTAGIAQVQAQLGNLLSMTGEHDLARDLHEESLALREAAGDARGIGLCLSDLGLAAARAGDPEQAQALLERARALFERTDDRPALAASLAHLGYVAVDQGRPAAAAGLLEGALALYVDLVDHAICAGWVLTALADVDRPARARERLREAARRFAAGGEQWGVEYCERRLNAEVTAG